MSVNARACCLRYNAVQYDGTNGHEIAARWADGILLAPVTDNGSEFVYNTVAWGVITMLPGQYIIEQVDPDGEILPWQANYTDLRGFILLDTVPQT